MTQEPDLEKPTVKALLRLHASIIEELKNRGVVRTKNNPVGDYTEWLVARALDLELAPNSAAGYDATDKDGIRLQIKGRRVTPDNPSRQLSAIRNLEGQTFDSLVGVVFDKDYSVLDARLIAHNVVAEYASFRAHTNAHILHLKGKLLDDPRAIDISASLAPVASG